MQLKHDPSIKQIVAPVTLLLLLFLVAGCARETTPPPATPTSAPAPLDVTYCDIKSSNICLEGFGLNSEDKLLVLFKAAKPRYRDIYIRADGPEGESLFQCQQSGSVPENIYCRGEPLDEQALIKMNIFSRRGDALLAIGVFNLQLTSLPEPDFVFALETSQTPSPQPSYPNPAGPTPSYPNPTSAP